MTTLYRKTDKGLEYLHIRKYGDMDVVSMNGRVGFPASYIRRIPHATEEVVAHEIEYAKKTGYYEVPLECQIIVGFEYHLDNWGSPKDIDKLSRLRDLLYEPLASRGLLIAYGTSIGSGIMEVHYFVPELDLPKALIEEMVKGTEFGDYNRLFAGNAKEVEFGPYISPYHQNQQA